MLAALGLAAVLMAAAAAAISLRCGRSVLRSRALAARCTPGVLGGPAGGRPAAHGLGLAAQEGPHHHCQKGEEHYSSHACASSDLPNQSELFKIPLDLQQKKTQSQVTSE